VTRRSCPRHGASSRASPPLANLKCAYFRNTVFWNSQTHEAFLCFETCYESLPCNHRTSTFRRLAAVLKCIAGCLQLLGIHLISSKSKSSIVPYVMSIFLLNLHVVNRYPRAPLLPPGS